MAEYHKMMHMDEVEPDALDEYLSINEEDRIKRTGYHSSVRKRETGDHSGEPFQSNRAGFYNRGF